MDIVQVLTQQPDYQAARKYWRVLKGRLAREGSELVTNCYQLKMAADDGEQRLTDVASAEALFVPFIRSLPRGDGGDSVNPAPPAQVQKLIVEKMFTAAQNEAMQPRTKPATT